MKKAMDLVHSRIDEIDAAGKKAGVTELMKNWFGENLDVDTHGDLKLQGVWGLYFLVEFNDSQVTIVSDYFEGGDWAEERKDKFAFCNFSSDELFRVIQETFVEVLAKTQTLSIKS